MMEVKHHNIANQSQKSHNNKKLRTESNVKNTYKSKFEVEDGETRRGHDSLWGSDRILIGDNGVVRL